MKRIIFFGFSVTAQKNGFVDRIIIDGTNISKVGVGGIHPNHAKYLFEYLLGNSRNADFIVLDLATSGFRAWLSKGKYYVSLLSILNDVFKMGATPVLLDLPRRDALKPNDWVEDFHASLSKDLDIPYLSLKIPSLKFFPTIDCFLKDAVHPTESGNEFYSSQTQSFLTSILAKDFINSRIRFKKFIELNEDSPVKFFDFIPILKCLDHSSNVHDIDSRSFCRTGIKLQIISIPEGRYRVFSLPKEISKKYIISGLAYLMGPNSGNLVFQTLQRKDFPLKISAYDQFCYYERLNAMEFGKTYSCSQFSISQTSDIPPDKLLKGIKNNMCRVANIAGLLVKNNFDINIKNNIKYSI